MKINSHEKSKFTENGVLSKHIYYLYTIYPINLYSFFAAYKNMFLIYFLA